MDAAVGIVKAYLELSGYFVLTELPMRVRERGGYRDVTDLDVVAVRFPEGAGRRDASDSFLDPDPRLGARRNAFDVVIGEVKEGKAALNPALRRTETIAFALRRVGCCPEDRVDDEARIIARRGRREMALGAGLACVVRIVAFAGGHVRTTGADRTVPLDHCLASIAERLHRRGGALLGATFKDATLDLIALQEKLRTEPEPSPATRPAPA